MDAVGAAANIAQLIILACEVAGRTADFCSSAKEQPKAYRNLAIQLPAVIEICERYHKLSNPEIDNSHLAGVLDECTRHVRDLNDLLGKLLPKEGDSLPVKGWKAAKSIALDKKVEQCSQKLETFKTLLSLELGLMTYEATVKENGDNDEPQIEIAHHHHLPTGRVGRFLGRGEFLSRIDGALKPAGSSAPKVCVLLGLGGQGKTSLAFEYCRRETERGYFGSIMWFDATSRATVQMRFAQIADKLCDHQRRFENPEAAIHHVSSTLSSLGSPWLFVLDNYDRVESFRGILSLLPDVPNGSVLITSRHSGCASLGTCIPLTGMAEPEAVELLLERAAIKPTPETETEARTVVALLGYLPLAIDQTTAYIRSRKISLGEFVRHYNKRKDRIIAFKPTVSDYYRMRTDTLDHSSEPESLSVWTTWEMSFDQIKTSDSGLDPPHLRHFLSTLAFFNKLDIGMDMFQAHYEENPSPPSWMEIFVDADYPEWDKYSYQDAVSFLEQLSLIQCHQKSDRHTEAGSPYVSLHPLVRDWIQLRLPSKERRDHCVEALKILRHYISAGQRRSDWPLVARRGLLSHLNAALYFQAQFIKSWDDARYADLGDCLQTFVSFYADHGRYTEAEQTCQRLLDCVTNKPDSKSEEIISAEILLSGIHFQQGRYSDVEKNMLRCNELVAPSWPLPIRIGLRKTLGRCYFKQGRYDEATSHFTWALNEQLTEHPSTDPDVLDIKESLAQIYRNQGNHKQATSIYKSVLQDCEPENPRIWRVKVNLANNYRAMNLSSQAAELYEQALAGFIPALGPDHPSTIETQLFSAINRCSMGQYHVAEEVLQDVVAKSHKVLGPKHPDTLKAIMNLAILLYRSGRLKEAEAMYRTALAGREESLGLDNPYTLRTVERLVGLLWALGKVEAAEALALRGLRVDKRGSVEEQMRALSVHEELGVDDKMQDLSLTDSGVDVDEGGVMFGASEVLLRQAIARDEAALERNHPDVLDFLQALMLVRKKQGSIEGVEWLQQSIAERVGN